jgi:hypothetical protein
MDCRGTSEPTGDRYDEPPARFRSATYSSITNCFSIVGPSMPNCRSKSTTWAPSAVPEVRRLLCRLRPAQLPPVAHTLSWSLWRRHQARDRLCHYRRRLAHLPPDVRL